MMFCAPDRGQSKHPQADRDRPDPDAGPLLEEPDSPSLPTFREPGSQAETFRAANGVRLATKHRVARCACFPRATSIMGQAGTPNTGPPRS
jgi:hypothetical protein